jgi:response regulator RpfG family c-di-GMP phosphodiesterase
VPLAPAKIKMVCDVLVRDRLLKPEMVETVTGKAQRTGDRVEEVILDLGLVSESDLLKSLATHYKVYFISTEKLSQVNVPRGIVEMVSQRFAEKMGVCPVMYDGKNQSLSVVTSDPDDIEALQETQLASGARDVKGIYARPAAVKALMAKAYQGDTRAFAQIDRPGQNLNTYGSDIAIDIDLGPAPAQAPRIERIEKARPPSPPAPPPVRSPASANRSAPPAGSPVPPSLDEPDAGVTLDGPLDRRERSERPERTGGARAAKSAEKVSDASFVELLHVLVSLLESSRADLRGHSAEVARLVRRVGDKLGLDPSVTAMFVVAAFVHDLGKMGQYHLTTLNCSEYDGHKAAAQKAWELPARLLEPVRLPPDALQIASRMYERYDGKGFPDGLSGKDIPLGARVLAVCDTYADLTSNARNPFRKTLSPQEACIAIAKHKETIFDPNVFDLFRNTVLGEELTAKLLANRSQALLVDADPEETTVLELRLIEQGFVVKTARSVEQALKILGDGDTDLVVSEIEIGSSDGLGLLADARKQPWGKDLAWVVYTRRHERTVAQKAFDLGVLDYVTKPASADLLVAKLKALLDQRASASPRNTRGVSGSLREMGLPDMVQVLFHGRKTGKLEIRAPQGTGEIHFAEGNIVDAVWRDGRGEPAFYAMLKLTDGDFALDPSFKPPTRAIQQSPEALLLEGMRRLDEGIA